MKGYVIWKGQEMQLRDFSHISRLRKRKSQKSRKKVKK